jgi:hypothetical protein
VSTGGELSSLVLPAIHLTCSGAPSTVWSQDFGPATTVVQRDGIFSIEEFGRSHRITVSGLLTVGIATGSVEIEAQVAGSTCSAPGLRWTAAAAVLTGP